MAAANSLSSCPYPACRFALTHRHSQSQDGATLTDEVTYRPDAPRFCDMCLTFIWDSWHCMLCALLRHTLAQHGTMMRKPTIHITTAAWCALDWPNTHHSYVLETPECWLQVINYFGATAFDISVSSDSPYKALYSEARLKRCVSEPSLKRCANDSDVE
jgi:hypothetical protein